MIHPASDPSGGAPEPMRYQMLGDDGLSPAERLTKYRAEADWAALRPHFQTGALLYVDPVLDLTEVGLALTTDDRTRVEAWLKAGDLVRPSQPHAEWWEKSGEKFLVMVVSPFVLMQPLRDGPPGAEPD